MGPLWAKAPFVLLRFRGLFVALAGGAALVALAAAAPPLFVSSVASSALQDELEATTRYVGGLSLVQNGYFVRDDVRPGGATPRRELTLAERNQRIRGALAGVEGLGEPVVGVLTNPVLPTRTRAPSSERAIRLLSRTGALAHVERLAGRGGKGVWLANTTAESLRVRPGDSIFLGDLNGDRPRQRVRVAGVYRALYLDASTPYWSPLYADIYAAPEAPVPEVFAIADEALVVRLATRLGLETQLRSEWPLASTALTLGEAERVRTRLAAFEAEASDPTTPIGSLMTCGQCSFEPLDLNATTSLPDAIDLARETVSTLRGPADLLSTAGLLVALAVLAAAGAFSAARRKVENGVMFARGMSPTAVGVKAAAESLLPVALGVAVGLAAALALVAAVGPGAVASEAVVRSAQLAALAIPGGAAALGIVAGIAFRRHADAAHARASLLGRVPWELAAVALAAFFFYRLRTEGAFLGDPAEGPARPSVALLLFPFFFIGRGAGLAARGLREPLRSLRRRSGGFGAAGYLAVRRVAGTAHLSLLLMVGCAVALGTLVYAQAVVRSLDAAVVSKSLLFVGSDVAGTTSADRVIPDDLPYPATMVTKLVERGDLDGVPADVLAIDGATFARAAYWEDEWASRSLSSIVGNLARGGGDALPVVVAGSSAPAPGILEVGGTAVPLEVVERARAFPGMSRSRPLVVADRAVLQRVFETAGSSDPVARLGAQTEVWVKGKGDPRAAARALASSELRPFPVLTAEEVRDTPSVRAVTNTFAFLNALGVAAGLLSAVAIVLYVQARQRAGAVAHALARRMGLTDGQHRTSLTLEVGAVLGASLVVGAALALVATRFLIEDVDPRPSVPPEPVLSAPWTVIAATAATLVGVAALGGALAHAVTARARVAEVLRAGE